MAINKLPEYVINRLKAWEVVNRPSSVLKELVENSLDAWAQKIEVNIKDGWRNMISIKDDGEWIQLSDMDLLLERYATSKIKSDEDLMTIDSYGFRWEALASIAEVAKLTVLSKTAYSEIGTKLTKRWSEKIIDHVPVPFEHGTLITIEDLFYNVPARLKFLKSAQTEFYYCYNYFVNVALWHYDKGFILKKNDKLSFDLRATNSLINRINDIYKRDWTNNLKTLEYKDDNLEIRWVVSDPNVRFGSAENIKIYVNSRPVQDKVIYKALMDAYRRQLTPGEYPLSVIMIDIKSDLVDVNVHPAKLQVKFLDTQKIYQLIYNNVYKCLGENKIAEVTDSYFKDRSALNFSSNAGKAYAKVGIALKNNSVSDSSGGQNVFLGSSDLRNKDERKVEVNNLFWVNDLKSQDFNLSGNQSFDNLDNWNLYNEQKVFSNDQIGDYQVVWQLRNSYIVLQSNDDLYYVDQHALAERIAYENMKKSVDTTKDLLLQPVKFNVTDVPGLDDKIWQLNNLWFDCNLLWENMMVVYAVPKIFVTYPVDLEKLFNHVLYLDEINFDHILDGIFATKACKTSIKAGNKLSYDQMSNLIADWFENIEWMFVCQHGRPFFIKMDKKKIDWLFDR